jgi:hypothetical protein
MITKRFNFNLIPLTLSYGITLSGTVPDEQNYSAYTNEYIPDYTVAPVLLQPWVRIRAKDGRLTSGSVNGSLSNIKWVEVIGDTETVITTGNDYEVVTSGATAGLLRVKKNVTPDTTITLKFSATYVDSQMKQSFYIADSYLLSCYSASKVTPTLALSVADSNVYNPLIDNDTLSVQATLYMGLEGEAKENTREFVWSVSHDGKTFHTVGTSKLDYYATVSADGTVCTVDRSKMGELLYLKCQVRFDEGGNPSSVTFDGTEPHKTITFTRRIPSYTEDIYNIPNEIPYGTQYIYPVAHFDMDGYGEIDDFDKVFIPMWYIGTNQSTGEQKNKTWVAYGKEPELPTSAYDTIYGGVVTLDLQDRGPLAALTDKDGAIMTDKDGTIMLIH